MLDANFDFVFAFAFAVFMIYFPTGAVALLFLLVLFNLDKDGGGAMVVDDVAMICGNVGAASSVATALTVPILAAIFVGTVGVGVTVDTSFLSLNLLLLFRILSTVVERVIFVVDVIVGIVDVVDVNVIVGGGADRLR